MATRTISTKLAVEGESQYRQAISSINSELGNLNSKLKLVKSEFQNHQNSMAALQSKSEALAEIQEAQSKKVETLKTAYANAQNALNSYEQKVTALKSSLKENSEALSAMDSSTKQSGKEWASYASQAAEAEKKLEELRSTTGDTSEEEAKLEQEIAYVRSRMAELEEQTGGAAQAAGELLLEQQKLTSELDKAEAGQTAATKACNNWSKQLNTAQIQLNNTNAEIELNDKYLQEAADSADGCAKSIDEFGNRAKDAGEQGTESLGQLSALLASAGIADKLKDLASKLNECATAAGNFHSQMSTVEAISGATSAEMADLTALAKEMGATTQFTANQAGEAMEYMAMAGWKAESMIDGLAGIMNLAAASGEDLGTASDIVTDALTAFGLAASDSGHFADILAQVSASANTNVGLLGESFKYVAPLCGTLGYSAEDASIALGLMANAGIKGSQAGTSLKTALANLSAPTDKQAAMMDKLGISLQNSDGTMKSLREVMTDLRRGFEDLDSAEQTAAASTIFGKEAMSGMLNIINASDDDFNKLTESIDNCSGAADRMADIQLDNYAGQITLLESATEGLTISIGEALTPALGDLAEMAAGAASAATEFVDAHPGVVAAVVAIGSALAVLTAGIAVMTVVQLPALAAAVEAVTVAVSANPIGMLITALAAGGVAVASFVGICVSSEKESRELEKATKSLTESIKEQKAAYESICKENKTLAKNNSSLADSLGELLKKSNKTASDHEHIKYIVDQLNESIPNLALAYDKEKDSINMTTSELNRYLEAAGKQADYEADVERMNELYSEQVAIEEQLSEAQTALFEAQEAQKQVLESYGEEYGYMTKQYQDASSKVVECRDAIDELTAAQEENKNELTEVEEAVNSYGIAVQQEMANASESTGEAVASMTGDMESLKERYDEVYDKASESISGQIALWEKADEVTAKSSEDITAALESQTAYWNDYADNLENLMKRNIDGLDEFVSSVDDGSAEAAGYIAGLADMSDSELRKLIEKTYPDLCKAQERVVNDTAEMSTGYGAAIDEMVSSAKESIGNLNLENEAEIAGENTLGGYRIGLYHLYPKVNADMVMIAAGAQKEFSTKMGIRSPSTVYEGFGKNTIQGYINGVNSQNVNMIKNMREMAQTAIASFKVNATSTILHSAGVNTLQGYINGLASKSGSLYSKMRSIASSAISAFKEKLGIHSPSTIYDGFGVNTILGYIQGNEKMLPSLNQKMKEIAEKSKESFVSGINLEPIDFQANLSYFIPSATFDAASGFYGESHTDAALLQEQLQKIDLLYQVMKIYLPKIANMKIMLDKNTLVGELTPGISEEIGKEEKRIQRGG